MARWKTYFSLKGRASRLAFWRFFLLQSLAAAGIMVTTSFATIIGGWLGAVPALLIVPLAAAAFCISVRRFHDRGRGMIWALVFTIGPFTLSAPLRLLSPEASTKAILAASLAALAGGLLALWSWIELGVLPGQKGPNRFGPDPYGRTAPTPAD